MESLSPVLRSAALTEINGAMRITGGVFTGVAAGGALELYFDGSNAGLNGYDRVAGTYKQLVVDALGIIMRVSGNNRMIISNDGIDVPALSIGGVPVVPGPHSGGGGGSGLTHPQVLARSLGC